MHGFDPAVRAPPPRTVETARRPRPPGRAKSVTSEKLRKSPNDPRRPPTKNTPRPHTHAPIGTGRVHGEGTDITMVTAGNGVYLSRRVARRLAADGIGARVLDLRWLAPLPVADLVREATATGRVLVVDETRRSGGVSEGVVTALVDHGYSGALARVTSEDSFIPLGDAARHVLLSEATIEAAARKLVG